MTWFGSVYVTFHAIAMLLMLSRIEEPRKPVTVGEALFTLMIEGLMLWGLFTVGVTS